MRAVQAASTQLVRHLLLLCLFAPFLPPLRQSSRRAVVVEANQPSPCDMAHPKALYGNVYALAPDGALCLLTTGSYHQPSLAAAAYCPALNQSASIVAMVQVKCVQPYAVLFPPLVAFNCYRFIIITIPFKYGYIRILVLVRLV